MDRPAQRFSPAFRSSIGVILAVCFGVLALTLDPIYQSLNNQSYDLLYSLHLIKPLTPMTDVVMVYLDDASCEKLGQPKQGRWDRKVHARLLDRLKAEDAKAAIFDIVFAEPGDQASDAEFARAIRAFGHVLLAAETRRDTGNKTIIVNSVIAPQQIFMDAAKNVAIPQLELTKDRRPRLHPRPLREDPFPLMQRAAADLFGAVRPSTTAAPTDDNSSAQRMWIRYYGGPFSLAHVSYHEALATNGVPTGFFKNKIVFIGDAGRRQADGSRYDTFITPSASFQAGENALMPGTEVAATLFLNIADGAFLQNMRPTVVLGFTLAFGLLVGILVPRLRPIRALGSSLAGTIVLLLCVRFLASSENLWFPWLIVAGQMFVALGWAMASSRPARELDRRANL